MCFILKEETRDLWASLSEVDWAKLKNVRIFFFFSFSVDFLEWTWLVEVKGEKKVVVGGQRRSKHGERREHGPARWYERTQHASEAAHAGIRGTGGKICSRTGKRGKKKLVSSLCSLHAGVSWDETAVCRLRLCLSSTPDPSLCCSEMKEYLDPPPIKKKFVYLSLEVHELCMSSLPSYWSFNPKTLTNDTCILLVHPAEIHWILLFLTVVLSFGHRGLLDFHAESDQTQ